MSVIITKKDNVPQLELRRRTNESHIMKSIIMCAIEGRPIIILPVFRNKLMSVNSLVQSGIMYYDVDTGSYQFNI